MSEKILNVRLFGGFACDWSDGTPLDIRGAKHRALIAMLATSKNGTHSRRMLYQTLWSRSGEEHGRSSLRRSLSDLRKIMGADFDLLFTTSMADITIDISRVRLLGNPSDGLFLDGVDLRDPKFDAWVAEKRNFHGSRAFQVLEAGREVTPRIAVLPFVQHMANPATARMGEWLSCELTRVLSRSYLVEVVSHLSMRQFDSNTVQLAQVTEVLDADYVVTGHFAASDDSVRLTVDLCQAASGKIVLSETVTLSQKELVAGQSNHLSTVATRIGFGIFSSALELAESQAIADVSGHALLMSAIGLMHQHQLEGFARARTYLRELIYRYPTQGALSAWLGKWHVLSVSQGWSDAPARDFEKATACADQALDTTPDCPFSLAISGMIKGGSLNTLGGGAQLFERALELDPNNSLAWLLYSRLHIFAGNGEAALRLSERACNLSPLDPYKYFYDIMLATAQFVCGDYNQALMLAERSITANPRHTSSHRVRTIALQMLDRGDEARAAAAYLRKLEPQMTVKSYAQSHPAGDTPMVRTWAKLLEETGIPKG
ncbi:MAG: hypothetical protein AAGL96_01605 [Pseudomonadota bacterium]